MEVDSGKQRACDNCSYQEGTVREKGWPQRRARHSAQERKVEPSVLRHCHGQKRERCSKAAADDVKEIGEQWESRGGESKKQALGTSEKKGSKESRVCVVAAKAFKQRVT